MRLTENQLRKVIRSVIKENQQHFKNLMVLLSSDKADQINSALELASTMGYIKSYTYQKKKNHKWNIIGPCDPQLLQLLGLPYNRVTHLTTFTKFKYGKNLPAGYCFSIMLREVDKDGYVSF